MNNAELFNVAGSKLTEMDAYLARATERMAVQDYGSAQRNVSAAHILLGDAGKALGEAAKAVLGGGPAKPTGLKPGQKVGDVGGNEDDPQYSGAIDPATLTVNNWAYYQAHNLGHLASKIFSGRQSDMNAALAKYHGGDLTADVVPEAGPLGQFG